MLKSSALYQPQQEANAAAREAFALLQTRHQDDIYTYLVHLVGEHHAEKVWNDTWLHAYNTLTHAETSRLGLLTIATHFAGRSWGSYRQAKGALHLMLPFDQRAALILRDRFDCSYEDVRQILGWQTTARVARVLLEAKEAFNVLYATAISSLMDYQRGAV